jgi:hypothetical protein
MLNPMQILASAPRQDVRFGSKAEVKNLHFDVCFTPESDIERVFAHVR